MSSIIPFTFPETGQPVRVPEIPGEPVIKGLEAHLYVIEFDGCGVKVGYTAAPQTRLVLHQRNARNFGRIAIRGVLTGPHIEAMANERQLIKLCAEAADIPAGSWGEYFPIDLETATAFLDELPQTRGDRVAFEAETKRRSEWLLAAIKDSWERGERQEKQPVRFGPVFPWAKFMDISSVDEFVQDLRDALDAPDPLAAIDHVAFDAFLNVAADLALDAEAAAPAGGAA